MYQGITAFLGSIIWMALLPCSAQAEFLVSNSIIEFTKDSPRQKDIELLSRGQDNDYIVCEVTEVQHPGTTVESRRLVDDPAQSGLLVTPSKIILAAGTRKVLRFVRLTEPDAQEHIYRVAVKPVVKGVENNSKLGLKVLIGYEVLVIVRPANFEPQYTAKREGRKFIVSNTGNTDILFQNGQQCESTASCKLAPVIRVYPQQQASIEEPLDLPVHYGVWDGRDMVDKTF